MLIIQRTFRNLFGYRYILVYNFDYYDLRGPVPSKVKLEIQSSHCVQKSKSDNHDRFGIDCFQQLEHMQIPNGTGPGVRGVSVQ